MILVIKALRSRASLSSCWKRTSFLSTSRRCVETAAASSTVEDVVAGSTEYKAPSFFERSVQHGHGRLVATADEKEPRITRLTTIRHQAPARLIPIRASPSPAVRSKEASAAQPLSPPPAAPAVCVLSNYGGGMLTGDVLEYDVQVQRQARLVLTTQGSNRIYKQSRTKRGLNGTESSPSCSRLTLRLEPDSLCVVAPDPVTPLAASVYHQQVDLHVHPTASLAYVDWCSSGRYTAGEQWQATSLRQELNWYFEPEEDRLNGLVERQDRRPFLREAIHLQSPVSGAMLDWSRVQWNAYATLWLYGSQVERVIQHCQQLQQQLVSAFTSTVSDSTKVDDDRLDDLDLRLLSGRVLLGISHVDTMNEHGFLPVYVARFMATNNEDLYRVLAHCLEPMGDPSILGASAGRVLYQNRIHASQSASAPALHVSKVPADNRDSSRLAGLTPEPKLEESPAVSPSSSWNAFMWVDSALPVGSFAHSAGVEAASQLGMLPTRQDLITFIESVTQSTLQLYIPYVSAAHQQAESLLRADTVEVSSMASEWLEMDHRLHAQLLTNSPSCRASLDQGRNLLRVTEKWLETDEDTTSNRLVKSLQEALLESESTSGHLATVFGTATALLDLPLDEAHRVMAYCVARDVVSAAVRLNLIGPLASVQLLAQAQHAAEQSIRQAALVADGTAEKSLEEASTCSPVVDTLQSCHDLLSMRLFRS